MIAGPRATTSGILNGAAFSEDNATNVFNLQFCNSHPAPYPPRFASVFTLATSRLCISPRKIGYRLDT